MGRKQDELLDHNYDGIREFDNDLPGWWLGLFWFSIIFSVFYMIFYHGVDIGYSSKMEYLAQMDPDYQPNPADRNASLFSSLFPSYKSPFYAPTDVMQSGLGGGAAVASIASVEVEEVDTTVVALIDEASIAAGKKIYSQYCFTCHGRSGEGGIGPNLTDNFWIHGNSFADITHTIKKGVPIKGMIAWETQLPPSQIIQVGSYIQTLLGTNPPKAKEPEGEEYAVE